MNIEIVCFYLFFPFYVSEGEFLIRIRVGREVSHLTDEGAGRAGIGGRQRDGENRMGQGDEGKREKVSERLGLRVKFGVAQGWFWFASWSPRRWRRAGSSSLMSAFESVASYAPSRVNLSFNKRLEDN